MILELVFDLWTEKGPRSCSNARCYLAECQDDKIKLGIIWEFRNGEIFLVLVFFYGLFSLSDV